ncbi:MAG: M28 family peptidase [Schleiferiaceae bacterium]|nr:M28 family peptidase [Schleiferiaceae bacterium]
MKKYFFPLFFLLSIGPLSAQECLEIPDELVGAMQEDVVFLAADELQGRAPGTEGLRVARKYLTRNFKNLGLTPAFPEGYRQEFSVPHRVEIRKADLEVARKFLEGKAPHQAYPVRFSGNGQAEGSSVYVGFGLENQVMGVDQLPDEELAGAIAVMEAGYPADVNLHSHAAAAYDLFTRLKKLQEKGAKGVILIQSKDQQGKAPQQDFDKRNSVGIPVLYEPTEKWARRLRKQRSVSMTVDMELLTYQVSNVAGWINNEAPTTVVIGAHYDHLGMGRAGSLYRGDEPAIHNGADDNASGVAGMLTLARFLSTTEDSRLRRFNYLFVGFSAEEMGLLGSNYFVENLPALPEYNFMFNMDMIGRMEERQLQVNGVGTARFWPEVLENISCGLNLTTTKSGVGPSDHSSFYYQKIPALHFFTGTHEDYHKPSDDAEKVNYAGMLATVRLMASMIAATPPGRLLEFKPTNNKSTQAPSFSVTLGVMPDYLFSGNGMKIDGVSAGRPADKAGMKAGDVVVKMGDIEVSDMQSYMRALSQFEEGDQTKVTYSREGERYTVKVKF